MTPDVTVAVCTYNRARLLPQALDSVLQQTIAPDRFEILVVDNGSDDGTADVIAAYLRKHPSIRLVTEKAPGVSRARNRAVGQARGTYVAFLDDDAVAEPGWLKELVRCLQEIRPTPACVVGPVQLVWEGGRPPWFPVEREPLLCRYDMGLEGRFLDANDYLLTTNVLLHRATLLELGGFRSYLGRVRGRPLGGEDNDIYHRLISGGHRIYYQPSAVVHHGVPPERGTRRYLLARLFWDGATQPLLAFSAAQQQGETYHSWRGARYDLRQCLRLGIILARDVFDRRDIWSPLYTLIHRCGRLRGHIALAAGSRR